MLLCILESYKKTTEAYANKSFVFEDDRVLDLSNVQVPKLYR